MIRYDWIGRTLRRTIVLKKIKKNSKYGLAVDWNTRHTLCSVSDINALDTCECVYMMTMDRLRSNFWTIFRWFFLLFIIHVQSLCVCAILAIVLCELPQSLYYIVYVVSAEVVPKLSNIFTTLYTNHCVRASYVLGFCSCFSVFFFFFINICRHTGAVLLLFTNGWLLIHSYVVVLPVYSSIHSLYIWLWLSAIQPASLPVCLPHSLTATRMPCLPGLACMPVVVDCGCMLIAYRRRRHHQHHGYFVVVVVVLFQNCATTATKCSVTYKQKFQSV